jgi:hypothetical protein
VSVGSGQQGVFFPYYPGNFLFINIPKRSGLDGSNRKTGLACTMEMKKRNQAKKKSTKDPYPDWPPQGIHNFHCIFVCCFQYFTIE